MVQDSQGAAGSGCWVRALMMPSTQLVKTDQAATGVSSMMRVILR